MQIRITTIPQWTAPFPAFLFDADAEEDYDFEEDEVYDASDDMAVYDEAEGMSLGEDAGMASFG